MNTSSDEVTNCLLHRLIPKAITTDTHKRKRPLTLVWGMVMEHWTNFYRSRHKPSSSNFPNRSLGFCRKKKSISSTTYKPKQN